MNRAEKKRMDHALGWLTKVERETTRAKVEGIKEARDRGIEHYGRAVGCAVLATATTVLAACANKGLLGYDPTWTTAGTIISLLGTTIFAAASSKNFVLKNEAEDEAQKRYVNTLERIG